MKLRSTTLLTIFLLSFLLLTGCSVRKAAEKFNEIENKAESKLEKAENAIEDFVKPEGKGTEKSARITGEEAKQKALKHAGLNAGDVKGLRAEFEVDDKIAHYDVLFSYDRWDYEYEIHAETGEILSFEKDD